MNIGQPSCGPSILSGRILSGGKPTFLTCKFSVIDWHLPVEWRRRAETIMRPLLKFFLLTYAATWICWAASFAISRGSAAAEPTLAANPVLAVLAGAVFLLGVFAPALIALVLTEREKGTGGRAATLALLRRVFKWRVGARWDVFAIGYMPAGKMAGAGVHRVVTGA